MPWDGDWGDGLPGSGGWADGDWGDGLPLGPSPAGPEVPAEWIAEILIGSTIVWSSENSVVQQGIVLDVSGFTGVQTLKFRIRRLV